MKNLFFDAHLYFILILNFVREPSIFCKVLFSTFLLNTFLEREINRYELFLYMASIDI